MQDDYTQGTANTKRNMQTCPALQDKETIA